MNGMRKPHGRSLAVGVLGSARLVEGDVWWVRAHRLGGLLAQAGYAVVAGGYGGLMAAVSRGACESGGRVIGLPMRHWVNLEPNPWNLDLRWCDGYGTRLGYLLRCAAVIALPGGVGTLSEMAVVWASMQTENPVVPLVLLGPCWPPVISALREHLIIGDADLSLLRFAASPEDALAAIQSVLVGERRAGPGPYG